MDGKFYIKKFIRSDGETLSFDAEEIYLASSNTLLVRTDPATTAVEFTEADGGEMIRQRGAIYTQPVNGLIVPKTTDYWTLSTQLSQFFKFNYTYKIVYKKIDGSMFAVNNAWISTGLQIVPLPYEEYSEWTIELSIGNVAWTEYAEDSEGKEIYSNTIVLPLLTSNAGGEVWSNDIPEEKTGEGSEVVINDTVAGAVITDFRTKGDTFQQTSPAPTPNASQPITVVTGTQTVKVTNKNLLDVPNLTSRTQYGVTGTPNVDGSIDITGTGSSTSAAAVTQRGAINLPAGTYTFSIKEALERNFYIHLYLEDGSTQNIIISAGDTYATGVVDKFILDCDLRFAVVNTVQYNVNIKDIQLEQGSTTTTYQLPQSQSFTIDLGSTELCKVGTHVDYIYKSGSNWYVHKETGKVVFDGSESWNFNQQHTVFYLSNYVDYFKDGTAPFSDYFLGQANVTAYNQVTNYSIALLKSDTSNRLLIKDTDLADASALTTWLSNHNTTLYFPLATATNTKITNNTLIGQLNAVSGASGYDNKTIFLATPSSGDLPAILSIKMHNPTVYGEKWDNIGGVWEAGSGGVQTIDISSTQQVYPIWTVEGPSVNPLIVNDTTDTVAQYNGTVASGQTLTVNFEEGTAYLNSALATRYVSGYLSLSPGENIVGFNSDGGATQTSTISWNNIVN